VLSPFLAAVKSATFLLAYDSKELPGKLFRLRSNVETKLQRSADICFLNEALHWREQFFVNLNDGVEFVEDGRGQRLQTLPAKLVGQ
jgi:hypothetical protein